MFELIEGAKNNNTQKSTKWAVGVFEEWRLKLSKKEENIPQLTEMSAENRNIWLVRFSVEARRKDRKEFPPNTLYMICSGLLWHLRDCGNHDMNILDTNDSRFVYFQQQVSLRMLKSVH